MFQNWLVFQNWLMNTLNVFFPTVAVLLIFVSQRRVLRVAASLGTSGETQAMLEKHLRRINLAMALLAAWLIIQYAALVY